MLRIEGGALRVGGSVVGNENGVSFAPSSAPPPLRVRTGSAFQVCCGFVSLGSGPVGRPGG